MEKRTAAGVATITVVGLMDAGEGSQATAAKTADEEDMGSPTEEATADGHGVGVGVSPRPITRFRIDHRRETQYAMRPSEPTS